LVSIAAQRFIRKTRFDSIFVPVSIILGLFLYPGCPDKFFIGLDLPGFRKAGGLIG